MRSGTSSRKDGSSRSTTGSQDAWVPGCPWSRTTGGPEPRSAVNSIGGAYRRAATGDRTNRSGRVPRRATRTRAAPVTARASGTGDLGMMTVDTEEPHDPPPGHQCQRLDDDEGGHLRLALDPVDEADGDLEDASPSASRLVGHFDLEPVALS